jgi:hypothetical protein
MEHKRHKFEIGDVIGIKGLSGYYTVKNVVEVCMDYYDMMMVDHYRYVFIEECDHSTRVEHIDKKAFKVRENEAIKVLYGHKKDSSAVRIE